MRIKWLRTALKNLDHAVIYIAQDNPVAARKVATRIRDAVEMLEKFPRLGKEGRLKGTRELRVSGLPYVIRYRVTEECVEILRIHHSAQLWPEEKERP